MKYKLVLVMIFSVFCLKAEDTSIATFYVAKTGNDANNGTDGSPFLSINRGIEALVKKEGGSLVISAGDYRETLNLADLPSGHYEISRKEGNTVRILGSEQLTGWSKTPGLQHVYEIPFFHTVPKWSRHADPIFEDGNPSKKIEPRHYHPLQKNLQFRLPFTDIRVVPDVSLVEKTPGSYSISGQKLYLHTSNSTNRLPMGFPMKISCGQQIHIMTQREVTKMYLWK